MNVTRIEFDREKADALYRAYKAHRAVHTKEDTEVERIYYSIKRGRKVIQAGESIRQAGEDPEGRPKLAIVRADVKVCRMRRMSSDVTFSDDKDRFKIPKQVVVNNWPYSLHWKEAVATVPLIPVYLRPPAADLRKYHILWEADWVGVPIDPMLLRRIAGDAWIVVAAWDLTPIERAVLVGRK